MVDNVAISNRALAEIGSRSQISSMTDGSTEATYANLLYNDLRDFMLRQGDYDFSMKSAAAVAVSTPSAPWLFSYTHPSDAVRIRNLLPTGFNALAPVAVEWNVGQLAAGVRTLLTRVPVATVIYTFAPTEDTWDAMFTESYVRMLGSALAFALQNRIEASKEKLSEALTFAGIANLRDG